MDYRRIPIHAFEEWTLMHCVANEIHPRQLCAVGDVWAYLMYAPDANEQLYSNCTRQVFVKLLLQASQRHEPGAYFTRYYIDVRVLNRHPNIETWLSRFDNFKISNDCLKYHQPAKIYYQPLEFEFVRYKYTAIQAYYASLHAELLEIVCRPQP